MSHALRERALFGYDVQSSLDAVLWLWHSPAVGHLWPSSPGFGLWHGTGLLCGSTARRREGLCDRWALARDEISK
eukprot:1160265-Pelagomonas_calceolata.AAC.4